MVGYIAGQQQSAGNGNTYLGSNIASNAGVIGNYNTAIGAYAAENITSASNNTLLGAYAGANLDTGSGNTFIGDFQGEANTVNTVAFARSSAGSANGNCVLRINENNAFGIPATNGSLTVDYGTAGEVLTSAGAGAPPVWAPAGGGSETHLALAGNTIDIQSADYFTSTVTANTTYLFTNPPAAPNVGSFIVNVENTGTFTVTWPASVRWTNGIVPNQTANGRDIYGFFTTDGGTTYYGLRLSANVS